MHVRNTRITGSVYLWLTVLCILTAQWTPVLSQGLINPVVPVLPTFPGTRYPLGATSRAPILLEAFIELNCGDSAVAMPVLQRVVDHYGADKVELILYQLPLPYHRNAMVLTQVNIQQGYPTRAMFVNLKHIHVGPIRFFS